MDDDDTVSPRNFITMTSDDGVKINVLGDLGTAQQRVKFFSIKVMIPDRVPFSQQRLVHGLSDGRIEACRIRMGQNNRYLHQG